MLPGLPQTTVNLIDTTSPTLVIRGANVGMRLYERENAHNAHCVYHTNKQMLHVHIITSTALIHLVLELLAVSVRTLLQSRTDTHLCCL